MKTLRNLAITVGVVAGAYFAMMMAYVIVPVSIFLFVFYVVSTIDKNDTEV